MRYIEFIWHGFFSILVRWFRKTHNRIIDGIHRDQPLQLDKPWSPLVTKILRPIQRDRAIYGLSLIICAITYGLTTLFDVPLAFSIYGRSFFFAILATLILTIIGYFFFLLFHLTPSPFKQFWHKGALLLSHWPEIFNFLLLTFSLSLVLSCFTSLKTDIPAIMPFYLDPQLIQLDRLLHLGYMPWQLTHALFTSPQASSIINFFYNLWFFVVWGFFILALCLVWRPLLRQQMLLSICLTWFVNGGLLAILFASAGPPYAARLFPHINDFQPLFHLLTMQNQLLEQQGSTFTLWALNVQQQLWEAYTAHTMTIGMGISAMPSVHVSTTTLIAMSLYALNKKAGMLGWIYVGLIELGSVHLGWHYAVDGYAAILITAGIWHSVGYWQTRFCGGKDPQHHE